MASLHNSAAFLLVLLLTCSSASAQISGRVVDESGNPIQGVAVYSEHAFCAIRPPDGPCSATTDEEGRYSLPYVRQYDYDQNHVVRFRKKGYLPVTRPFDSPPARVDVTLQVSESPLTLPRCPTCKEKGRYEGSFFMVFIPKEVQVKKVLSGHSPSISLGFGPPEEREWLIHGYGFYPVGLPPRSELLELVEIRESDLWLQTRSETWTAIDIKGRKKDGSYYRLISAGSSTIRYDGVSKEAADYFDQTLETLCIRPQD